MRRLRIDLWFDDDIPFHSFVETISSLQHLEDFTLYLPPRLQEADVDSLRQLTDLPLRRLAFLKFSEISPNLNHAPVPLEGLLRSLVELDIDLCMPVSHPFPMICTLSVRVPTSDTFVADATAAFPNATQLILRRHVERDLFSSVYRGPALAIQRARAHNKVQWQSRYREAWSSLSAVWVVDLCMLYAIGFSRQVASVSIPFRKDGEEAYVASVLADTSPSFLELRLGIDDLPRPQADWKSLLGPSVSCVLRLKLLFEMDNLSRFGSDDPAEGVFDDICATLPAFTGLTHMLIKFAAKKTPCPGFECRPLDRHEVEAVEEAIRSCLPRFEQGCASLQWVAFDVYDLDLECWEISRADGRVSEEGQRTRESEQPELVPVDKDEQRGWPGGFD